MGWKQHFSLTVYAQRMNEKRYLHRSSSHQRGHKFYIISGNQVHFDAAIFPDRRSSRRLCSVDMAVIAFLYAPHHQNVQNPPGIPCCHIPADNGEIPPGEGPAFPPHPERHSAAPLPGRQFSGLPLFRNCTAILWCRKQRFRPQGRRCCAPVKGRQSRSPPRISQFWCG